MSTMCDAMTNCNPKGIITSKETKIARYTKSQQDRAVFNAKENNTVE